MTTGSQNRIHLQRRFFNDETARGSAATFLESQSGELGQTKRPGHLQAEFLVPSIQLRALVTILCRRRLMLEADSINGGVCAWLEPSFYRQLSANCATQSQHRLESMTKCKLDRPHAGEWFFCPAAKLGDGVVPDIVTLAKALGRGIPVGRVCVTESIGFALREIRSTGRPFGGGMIAMCCDIPPRCQRIEDDWLCGKRRLARSLFAWRLQGNRTGW